MRLYNTLKKTKEELQTLQPHEVSVYVCGPTTYNYIHLGNARPLVVFDTVRRYLEYRGYTVKYIQNFTDVDDKIINRAKEEKEDPLQLAERYIKAYFADADALGIKRADVHPRVSQHIPQIISAIEQLIVKGFAYVVDGDVFFRVRAFEEYGKLSGRSLEDMMAGARVDIDERKEAPADFALWKAAKAGEPSWDSPWGKGRPGWHIECSVMAMQYLGETIDIHGGGSDLIFPHHENEIAQSEALTGQPFVNYWMHNGFITVNNEKMSKSLGNFFILRDVLAKFPADVVRFYLVATHYRSPLDFDDGKLQEAGRALGRLKNTLNLVEEFVAGREKSAEKIGDHPLLQAAEDTRRQFIEAMDDDFNTARAISYLFELSHKINTFIASASAQDSLQQTVVQKARDVLRELGDVLGIFIKKDRKNDKAVADILNIFKDLRQEARSQKDFVLADEIRNFLSYCEVVMEDTPSGTRFRYSQEPPIDQLVQKLLDIREGFKREKNYQKADMIRNYLQETGIMIEDTPKGVRWRIADA